MKTVEAAKGYWPAILNNLGVDSNYLIGKHSTCPLCGQGKDTFRFDDKNGSGSYYCGKCGAGYGINFVMKFLNLSFADAAKRVDEIIGNVDQKTREVVTKTKDPRPLLRNITKGLQPISGTDAESYLRNRGLAVTSDVLKFHPGLSYWGRGDQGKSVNQGRFPALVAPILNSKGDYITYHVTYLSGARKASVDSPKKVMPPIETITGGAIRLFEPTSYLGIAEGIETALAVHQRFKIPVWATVSANGMESVIIPDEITDISIFSDNDASYAGQKVAFSLANRLRSSGKTVEVFIPDKVGTDFLDQVAV